MNTVQITERETPPKSDLGQGAARTIFDESTVSVFPCAEGALGHAGLVPVAMMRFIAVLKHVAQQSPYLITYFWGEVNRAGLVACLSAVFDNPTYETPYHFISETHMEPAKGGASPHDQISYYHPKGYVHSALAAAIPPAQIASILGREDIGWEGAMKFGVAAFSDLPMLDQALRCNPFVYKTAASPYLRSAADFFMHFDWDFDAFEVWSRDTQAAFDLVHLALKDLRPVPRFIAPIR